MKYWFAFFSELVFNFTPAPANPQVSHNGPPLPNPVAATVMNDVADTNGKAEIDPEAEGMLRESNAILRQKFDDDAFRLSHR